MNKSKTIIACDGLCAARDDHILTEPVSFTLTAGQYIQLRGANGCGKSTFLRHLAGLLPWASGDILLDGIAQDPHDIPAKRTISYLGHDDGMHGDLSGYEAYDLLTNHSPIKLAQSALYERPIATYSAGQRQKLTIHMLDDAHDLWLLDEPSASLDAANLAYLEERIAGYLALGGAVIASTHTALATSLVSQTITLAPAAKQGGDEL